MRIFEVKERTLFLNNQLIEVWEKSVRATHLFLSDKEINDIKKYVPQAINEIAHLIVLENESKYPVAFMGIEKQTLEMLFIAPDERGKGLGKRLMQYGIDNYSIKKLAVNEQNPLAKGFYEHMGFQVYKRTDYDEQGKPYPLLYMKLN
ncbi:GNAT family N-acetyltransferase [Thomasclavelia sp.]